MMKRSNVSFTSHLSELREIDENDSRNTSAETRVFRRVKSYSDVLNQNKRHTRRKTSPNSYFEFCPSRELTRDMNIGMDLMVLEHLHEEGSPSTMILPPSKFLPPPKLNSSDSTFGLMTLNIRDGDEDEDDLSGDNDDESSDDSSV